MIWGGRDEWYGDRLDPVLGQTNIGVLSWEETIEVISGQDATALTSIYQFYDSCLRFNS